MSEYINAETVMSRLNAAGRTLLLLPPGRVHPMLTQHLADVEAEDIKPRLRLCADPAAIDDMDRVFAWLSLIPHDRYVLRRIVGARSLVSPSTDKHLYSWRRLVALLGADHKAIQRWHAQGIDMIVDALRARSRGVAA